MKFMKLGSRPDTFFTTEAIRSVTSEVSTDIQIQVQKSFYLLHRFPLLSKCGRLRELCSEWNESSENINIPLHDIPGGDYAFEVCSKFCYGITISLCALNIIPIRCAAHYLKMYDDIDGGNLVGKLDAFFESCILRRWKDTLVTLKRTRQYSPLCEELGITNRCIDALAAKIITLRLKDNWAEDLSELWIDHYWRIMSAVNSAGTVSSMIIGKALQVYACQWLPNLFRDGNGGNGKFYKELFCSDSSRENTLKHRQILEKLISLLPSENNCLPCSFLLKLLKVANILNASPSLKKDLARRAGFQLEEATVSDLLIPSLCYKDEHMYDVDIVTAILDEFMLKGRKPPRGNLECEKRRPCSVENVEFEQENCQRVVKLIDCYLQEIARDVNLPIEKLLALAEMAPDSARRDHDDLYKVIDIYLRAHPNLEKTARKQLCRILNCKKLSIEACIEAAQNEQLPLRVVVQVLFFEHAHAAISGVKVNDQQQAYAAISGGQVNEQRPNNIKPDKDAEKLNTLRVKLAEDDDYDIEDVLHPSGLLRSTSSRIKALCYIPPTPKRIFSKLWSVNRSFRERT